MGHINRNGVDYEVVDARTYVNELNLRGASTVFARKSQSSGGVIARKGPLGGKVKVYTNDGNLEAVEFCGEGQWILTKADSDGNPIIDDYGHTNTWRVDDAVFKSKYEVKNMTPSGYVLPVSNPQMFIQIDKNVAIMKPWGENGELVAQTIAAGGYLNITNLDDIYGIAVAEFNETYTVFLTRG